MGGLLEAMTWLGSQPDTIFLGQSVGCPGTSMHSSLAGVPEDKLIEAPVAEDMQMGISIGLGLEGFCPISIYPRWNFLLLAFNQLVNHLDRLPLYSGYKPKCIIRTAVGANKPLDPGPQHQDDFTDAARMMLKTINVKKLDKDNVLESYVEAYKSGPTLLVDPCC